MERGKMQELLTVHVNKKPNEAEENVASCYMDLDGSSQHNQERLPHWISETWNKNLLWRRSSGVNVQK